MSRRPLGPLATRSCSVSPVGSPCRPLPERTPAPAFPSQGFALWYGAAGLPVSLRSGPPVFSAGPRLEVFWLHYDCPGAAFRPRPRAAPSAPWLTLPRPWPVASAGWGIRPFYQVVPTFATVTTCICSRYGVACTITVQTLDTAWTTPVLPTATIGGRHTGSYKTNLQ